MEKTKVKNLLRVLSFNVVETLVIFMIGLSFEIDYKIILFLMLVFFITRMICGQPKHYKKAYKCFIWSTLTFTSVYVITDLPLFLNVLLTIFAGFIATGRADIQDMYMWKGKESKYYDIEEFVTYNSLNSRLLEFESKLKDSDNLLFIIYKYRFKENMTFSQISEKLDGMETARISEKLDKIAFSLRLYCGI